MGVATTTKPEPKPLHARPNSTVTTATDVSIEHRHHTQLPITQIYNGLCSNFFYTPYLLPFPSRNSNKNILVRIEQPVELW